MYRGNSVPTKWLPASTTSPTSATTPATSTATPAAWLAPPAPPTSNCASPTKLRGQVPHFYTNSTVSAALLYGAACCRVGDAEIAGDFGECVGVGAVGGCHGIVAVRRIFLICL